MCSCTTHCFVTEWFNYVCVWLVACCDFVWQVDLSVFVCEWIVSLCSFVSDVSIFLYHWLFCLCFIVTCCFHCVLRWVCYLFVSVATGLFPCDLLCDSFFLCLCATVWWHWVLVLEFACVWLVCWDLVWLACLSLFSCDWMSFLRLCVKLIFTLFLCLGYFLTIKNDKLDPV